MSAIEAQIRQFVTENFLFGRKDTSLGGDDSLLQLGLIDSTGVLELVSFIESTFQIKIEDDELVPENLDSINRLTNFIDSKLAVAR